MNNNPQSLEDQLTDKQLLFCQEYLIDLNGTQAAIRAGYSERTANRIASENLSKPVIQKKISDLMAERSKRLQIDADWITQQYKSIAEDDLKHYMELTTNKKGELQIKWKDLTNIDTRNIQELQVKDGEIKIKRCSRENALLQLARHIGYYNQESSGNDDDLMAMFQKLRAINNGSETAD